MCLIDRVLSSVIDWRPVLISTGSVYDTCDERLTEACASFVCTNPYENLGSVLRCEALDLPPDTPEPVVNLALLIMLVLVF